MKASFPIVLILTVMILRAFVSQSFMTYLPVMVARLGYSLVSIGVLVSLFTIAGTLSGLLAGAVFFGMLGYYTITSASRTDPPGWITAVIPALSAISTQSGNGKIYE